MKKIRNGYTVTLFYFDGTLKTTPMSIESQVSACSHVFFADGFSAFTHAFETFEEASKFMAEKIKIAQKRK